jgi:DNA-binding LytR/AlgR family response regulator
MKLKCLIIDDEPSGRKIIEEFINETDYLELAGTAPNPVKAATLMNTVSPDLLFLDVQMPKINGIDFLKSLRNPPMVIFTTAFPEYALHGFELDVIDYLLKPVSLERFFKATKKAREFYDLKHRSDSPAMAEPAFFFVKCNNKYERMAFDDLLFIEAASNYIILQTTQKRHIAYLTFKSVSDHLPAERFIKVHKSYIVALDKIESLNGEEIVIGNHTIPISRAMKDEVMEKVVNRTLWKR